MSSGRKVILIIGICVVGAVAGSLLFSYREKARQELAQKEKKEKDKITGSFKSLFSSAVNDLRLNEKQNILALGNHRQTVALVEMDPKGNLVEPVSNSWVTRLKEGYRADGGKIAIGHEGRVFIVARFTPLDRSPLIQLVETNASGEVRTALSAVEQGLKRDSQAESMVVLPNGESILSGLFWVLKEPDQAAEKRNFIRLDQAGKWNPEWLKTSSLKVEALLSEPMLLTSDGKIIVMGSFKEQQKLYFPIAKFEASTGNWDVAFMRNAEKAIGKIVSPKTPKNALDARGNLYYSQGVQTDVCTDPTKAKAQSCITSTQTFSSLKLWRLNPKGNLIKASTLTGKGCFVKDFVSSMIVLTNGEVLMAGQLSLPTETTTSDGTYKNKLQCHSVPLWKVMPDGSIDGDFLKHDWPMADVRTLLELPDGRIVIGGGFEEFAGQKRKHIAVIAADGTLTE